SVSMWGTRRKPRSSPSLPAAAPRRDFRADFFQVMRGQACSSFRCERRVPRAHLSPAGKVLSPTLTPPVRGSAPSLWLGDCNLALRVRDLKIGSNWSRLDGGGRLQNRRGRGREKLQPSAFAFRFS